MGSGRQEGRPGHPRGPARHPEGREGCPAGPARAAPRPASEARGGPEVSARGTGGRGARLPALAVYEAGVGWWGREDDRGVELSDEVLCQRTAERDEAAFEVLVARYQERAYRLAWSLVRDAEGASDPSQEGLIPLYPAAGRFDRRSKFSTWFYRI